MADNSPAAILRRQLSVYDDEQLLYEIRKNIATQKRRPYASIESRIARDANRDLFAEAARRGLKGDPDPMRKKNPEVWTPAARAAFARKMKAARLAKRGRARVRKRNPSKAQVKAAAKKMAAGAARLAWRGAKLTGRAGKAGAKAAAAEVKASICRQRNPKRVRPSMRYAVKAGNSKRFVTQMRFEHAKDAVKFARLYAKANPRERVGVYRV